MQAFPFVISTLLWVVATVFGLWISCFRLDYSKSTIAWLWFANLTSFGHLLLGVLAGLAIAPVDYMIDESPALYWTRTILGLCIPAGYSIYNYKHERKLMKVLKRTQTECYIPTDTDRPPKSSMTRQIMQVWLGVGLGSWCVQLVPEFVGVNLKAIPCACLLVIVLIQGSWHIIEARKVPKDEINCMKKYAKEMSSQTPPLLLSVSG